jgi:hypothetical protein
MNHPLRSLIIYYLSTIIFHFVLFFTRIGNYWHGGTPFEAITLNTAAVRCISISIDCRADDFFRVEFLTGRQKSWNVHLLRFFQMTPQKNSL